MPKNPPIPGGIPVNSQILPGDTKAAIRAAKPTVGSYCATQPPSMFHATPRTWLAAALAEKHRQRAQLLRRDEFAATAAFRPASCFLASSFDRPPCAARASTCFCTSGVSTQPGQIALQVTPVVRGFQRGDLGQADDAVLGGDVGRLLRRRRPGHAPRRC